MGDSKPLAGMTAFITGGSGGIGSASARRLARDGAAVMLMARREDALARTREDILAAVPGAEIGLHVGDASDLDSVRAGLDKAFAMRGRLDIAVPTVAGGPFRPLLMLDVETLRQTLDLCITTAFMVIRYGAPMMEKGGAFVCISSNTAIMPFAWLPAYHTAKSGLEGLVRAAAEELGSAGIRVNAVRPGLTRTEVTTFMYSDPTMLRKYTEQTPLGRCGGEPEDVAEAVRYLAGPESAWVTGQSFAVDGGHELRRNPDLTDMVTQMFGAEAMAKVRQGKAP